MNARKFYNSNTGQFSIYIPDVNAMLERGGTSHVTFSNEPGLLDGEKLIAREVIWANRPNRWNEQIKQKIYPKTGALATG